MRAVLLHAVAAAALQPNEVWQAMKQQASVAASSSLSALMRPYLEDAIEKMKAGKKAKPAITKAIGCSIKRMG